MKLERVRKGETTKTKVQKNEMKIRENLRAHSRQLTAQLRRSPALHVQSVDIGIMSHEILALSLLFCLK